MRIFPVNFFLVIASILMFGWGGGSASVHAQYSGTYTLDPGLPAGPTNFTSFTAAGDSLASQGVSGEVIIEIADGIYTEQFSLGAIAGVSASRKVRFRSASGNTAGVILRYAATLSNANFVLKLDETDHVVFSDMTFQATGTTYARVIQLEDGANENTFESCRIEGQAPTTYSSDAAFALVYIYQFGGSSPINNQFLNDTLVAGSWGVHLRNSGGSPKVGGFVFDGNVFLDQEWTAFYAFSTDGNQVTGNLIQSSNIAIGMFISGANGTDWLIRDNLFLLQRSSSSLIGMSISYGSSASQILVANNMVHVQNLSGTGAVMGIRVQNCINTSFYHNTVKVEGGSSSPNSVSAIHDLSTLTNPSGPVNYVNNIFENDGVGHVFFFNNVPTSYLGTVNHNLYDKTGTNLVYWGGTSYPDIAAFQTLTGQDAQSVEGNAQLVSVENRLLVNGSQVQSANFAGTPLAEVPNDYYGDTRSGTAPRKGAAERGSFNPAFPVEWAFFTAEEAQTGVMLSWAIQPHAGEDGFLIERSMDGGIWEQIGQEPNSSGTEIREHSWLDRSPVSGKSYYRISQRDVNGALYHSPVRQVTLGIGVEANLKVFPNPVNDHFNVSAASPGLVVELYTVTGQLMKRKVARESMGVRVERDGLPSGLYVLKCYSLRGEAYEAKRLWLAE